MVIFSASLLLSCIKLLIARLLAPKIGQVAWSWVVESPFKLRRPGFRLRGSFVLVWPVAGPVISNRYGFSHSLSFPSSLSLFFSAESRPGRAFGSASTCFH